MRRGFAFVAGAALVFAACSSTGQTTTTESPVTTSPVTTSPVTTSPLAETTTTTVAETATTAAETTTTVEETTTTTAAETTTTTFYTSGGYGLYPPPPLPGSGGASGSGCSPGNPMDDGIWFAILHDKRSDEVYVDIACFWFGEIAYEKGEAAGEEINNDYWIQNQNNLMRWVPVAEDVTVAVILGDAETFDTIPLADWPLPESFFGLACPGDFCLTWLYVNDGVITEIVEQYVP